MGMVEDELRRQIKGQLEERKKAGMSAADLAKQLDIKTPAVYQLLEGETTPTAKVLCNACRNLQMAFRLDGHMIGAQDFPPPGRPPVTEVQLGLFDIAASSEDSEVTVRVTNRKAPQVALQINLRVAGSSV